MNKKQKSGISIIVLVITIIIIMILAGAAVLSLENNNPINGASESSFKNDLKVFDSELTIYKTEQFASVVGSYKSQTLKADYLTLEYNGKIIPDKTIKDVIPSLAKADKYDGQLEISGGKLVYLGTNRTLKRWAEDVNVEVIDADRLNVVITSTTSLPIVPGTDVLGVIKISSNASIKDINLIGNLELLDENNVSLSVQPTFEIGTPSGDETNALRNVDVVIKTNTLEEGIYKLKLKANSISNIYNIKNEKDIISGELFEIDNTPPTNPEILITPIGWTNSDVTVQIVYAADTVYKEYSLDGSNWNTYSLPITVSANGTTIYARATDTAGNQSGQSTITIASIDKDMPKVTYTKNGGTNLQSASTAVTVTDTGISGVNTSSLQYIWDTQNVDEPNGVWSTFVNGETITKSNINGAYYLWIKASDNAGNSIVTKSEAFVTDNIIPANPTMAANPTSWTNGNVSVTITYPSDASIKEYSTNGTTWNVYTSAIVVTTNNTTVYARATDASGNQSGQSTITIANIDKIAPTVAYGTNGSIDIETVGTTVSVSDLGGSNINSSTLQYVWDTQSVVTPSSGWSNFTNGSNITKENISGTYYLWIKASDNAGNSVVIKSNAFQYMYVSLLSKTNEVMSFDGTSTYIDTNLNPQVNFPNSYSIAVRFYATDKSAYRDIFGGHAGSDGIVAQFDGNGLSVAGIGVSGAVTDTYMNKWVNMVYTYDYTTKVEKLYLNNTLIGTNTRFFTTFNYFWIGKGYPNVDRYFLGSMEYLAVWNKALTAQEVSDLNSSGKATLNNMIYKVTLDSITNINNAGVVYGGTPVVGVNVMSKTNQVMSFNGTTTYIDTGLNPLTKFPNNYSVAVKYYATDKSAYRDIFGGHGGANGIVAQFDGSNLLVGGLIVPTITIDTYMNKWVNMVYTYDYTTKIEKLYMNNTLIATASRTFSTMSYFWIGKGYGASNRYFLGNIEYLVVWDRAITEQEIKTLNNSGNISSTNLVYKAILDSVTNISNSGTVYVGAPTLVAK